MDGKDMLKEIIKRHLGNLIEAVEEIASYEDIEDEQSLSVKVRFKEPRVFREKTSYTLPLEGRNCAKIPTPPPGGRHCRKSTRGLTMNG